MKPPLHAYAPDDFQTPPDAILPLLRYLPSDWTVWECAQGWGNLTEAFHKHGYQTVGSDIKTGQDFLTWEPEHFDCIVTNPPYSVKQKFLIRAYQIGKPFAFLLPLTTLETRTRQQLFKRYGVEIIMFDRRIDFITPDNDAKGSKAWFPVAWFTNGLNIGHQLNFVSLVEMKQMAFDFDHLANP